MITTTLPFSLRQLQYAVAVAEGLSFRKAATRCGVSQPSLSAQIAQLEGALGVVLFERDRRRVLVTTAGRDLLERARVILRKIGRRLADFARRAGDPFGGALRLGVIPTVSPYFLPRAAQTLHLAHPRLSVRWVEDRDRLARAQARRGLARRRDRRPRSRPRRRRARRARERPLRAGHRGGAPARQAPRARLALGTAGASVLLLDEGHCFREQALSYCAGARAVELEFRATSLTTLTQMVATGVGVTLLPRLAMATETAHAALTVREFAARRRDGRSPWCGASGPRSGRR